MQHKKSSSSSSSTHKNKSHKRWNLQVKPDANVCPKQYCLHWQEADENALAGRVYKTVEAALADFHASQHGSCICSESVCTRLDAENGQQDCYDPDESALQRDGLPWFYFIPDPYSVDKRQREMYMRESEALWGDDHWES